MIKDRRFIAIIFALILTAGFMFYKIEAAGTAKVKVAANVKTDSTTLRQQPTDASKKATNLNSNNNKTSSASKLTSSTTNSVKTSSQANTSNSSSSVSPRPEAAKATNVTARETTNVSRGQSSRTVYMVATGYTADPAENYPYGGEPSYIGLPLSRGIVAVDPNVIPMGTKLYVDGYGEAIAADQGGAIKGNRIDLFFDSKSEANNWGMRTVKVTIIK